MNFRFYITFVLAVSAGLFFGYGAVNLTQATLSDNNFLASFNQFITRDVAQNFVGMVNGIFKAKDSSAEDVAKGGPSAEETFSELEYERFPSNSPENLNKGFISEDLEIPKEGKAVVANLDDMTLKLYENGSVVETYEILSKGRKGTAWETPPGSFKVLYKKENHFSSIGKVWMPYSIQFFGNYFIHGWPYYPDGTPVAEGYSGGCIRLANIDMEKIYQFADVDTKVIVFGNSEEDLSFTDNKYQLAKNGGAFPKVTADAYLVADLETGEIIDSYAEKKTFPIASVTKLMTALISLDTINQYQTATVSKKAYATYGAQGDLKVGQKIEVGDLLYPLLLESSNDAAEVLAEFAGRSNFIENMNKKAESMGLKNTNFEDPSGLSENNNSTAEDLFKLTRYIYKYKNFIFELTQEKEFTVENQTWHSNSRFRNDENYLGGKNGYTDEARKTLVALFEIPLGEFEKRKIAVILLHADDPEKDTRNILVYLLNNVYYID